MGRRFFIDDDRAGIFGELGDEPELAYQGGLVYGGVLRALALPGLRTFVGDGAGCEAGGPFEHKLEEGPIVRRLWALKMRAFPPAFFCMALVIMLAVAGGAVQSQVLPVSVHRWLAYIVLGLNLVTIPIEVKVMGDNLALMEEVESRIAAGESAVKSSVGVGADSSAA
jgi:hypothetical protein